MDFTQYPMGFIGGVVALFVFGVFITTWWWYGMRAMARGAPPVTVVRPSAVDRLAVPRGAASAKA